MVFLTADLPKTVLGSTNLRHELAQIFTNNTGLV